LNRLFAAYKHWFQTAAPARRAVAGVTLLAAVAGFTWAVRLAFLPTDWQPLYPDLSSRASGEILEALEQLDLPVRVDSASGLLEVPAAQLHLVRMRLAARGLPRDESADAMPEPRLGTSSRMEQAQLQTALERTLASSIASLDVVREARVHLHLERGTPLMRVEPPSTAAVLLRLQPGATLSERDAETIRTLVAAAVPRLDAANVQVRASATPVRATPEHGVVSLPRHGAEWGLVTGLAVLMAVLAVWALWRRDRPVKPAEPTLDARLARLRHEALANPALTAEVIRQWLR